MASTAHRYLATFAYADDLPRALASFDAAVMLSPLDPAPWVLRAWLLNHYGDDYGAELAFERVLAVCDGHTPAPDAGGGIGAIASCFPFPFGYASQSSPKISTHQVNLISFRAFLRL